MLDELLDEEDDTPALLEEELDEKAMLLRDTLIELLLLLLDSSPAATYSSAPTSHVAPLRVSPSMSSVGILASAPGPTPASIKFDPAFNSKFRGVPLASTNSLVAVRFCSPAVPVASEEALDAAVSMPLPKQTPVLSNDAQFLTVVVAPVYKFSIPLSPQVLIVVL